MLKRIVGTIQTEMRNADCFGCYDGEEFLMILTETDIQAAETFAERIREVVEGVSLPALAGNRPTISIGIAPHRE